VIVEPGRARVHRRRNSARFVRVRATATDLGDGRGGGGGDRLIGSILQTARAHSQPSSAVVANVRRHMICADRRGRHPLLRRPPQPPTTRDRRSYVELPLGPKPAWDAATEVRNPVVSARPPEGGIRRRRREVPASALSRRVQAPRPAAPGCRGAAGRARCPRQLRTPRCVPGT